MACLRLVGWLTALATGVVAADLGTGGAVRREIEVLNLGIGGNTSRDGLARFQRDVEARRPQHLLIYFGINDALNSAKLVPVAEFRANLQAMIDRARTIGVASIILTTPNPIVASYVRARHPDHPRADLEAHLATYAAVIRELATANSLLLADLRGEIEQSGVVADDVSSVIRNQANSGSADGVHLTPAGYRLLATLYARLLAGAAQPGDVVLCFGDSLTWGANVQGAGSVHGQTYPAYLWLLLNRPQEAAREDVPSEPNGGGAVAPRSSARRGAVMPALGSESSGSDRLPP